MTKACRSVYILISLNSELSYPGNGSSVPGLDDTEADVGAGVDVALPARAAFSCAKRAFNPRIEAALKPVMLLELRFMMLSVMEALVRVCT